MRQRFFLEKQFGLVTVRYSEADLQPISAYNKLPASLVLTQTRDITKLIMILDDTHHDADLKPDENVLIERAKRTSGMIILTTGAGGRGLDFKTFCWVFWQNQCIICGKPIKKHSV